MLTSHVFDRLATRRKRIPLGERRGKIFLQRQATSMSKSSIGVASDVAHRLAKSQILRLYETLVKLTNFLKNLVRPGAASDVR